MSEINVIIQEKIDMAQKNLTRRGFQVVQEEGRIRFVGGDPDVIPDIEAAINSEEDEITPLSNLMNEMGFDIDLDGRYLVASPAL